MKKTTRQRPELRLEKGRPWRHFRAPSGRAICGTLLLLLILFSAPPQAKAIIFYWTGDSAYNTTAPCGLLAGSGWQWVGTWLGHEGTPIGPHHFLAARHIGGAVGQFIVFKGRPYPTTACFDDSDTDLRIWQIEGSFPEWAPLYRKRDEVGRMLVVIGSGVGRGCEVKVGGVLRGWQWGDGSGTLRWGMSRVSSEVGPPERPKTLLLAAFDPLVGPDSAHLGGGDSGAPVFIDDGDGWKLAGIASGVDGPFAADPTGPSFNAALFDARGLYGGGEKGWRLINAVKPVRSGFYSTRVSIRLDWIDKTISAVQETLPMIDAPQRPIDAATPDNKPESSAKGSTPRS